MEKTIWKFELKLEGWQYIEMPLGSEILTIKIQNEKPNLWALVNPKAEKEQRIFETFGTGHIIPDSIERNYIDSYQQSNGNLIFHVFERIL